MPNYYRTSEPSDLRDLPQSLIDEWESAGNPKLQAWTPAPPKPADNAVWDNGTWAIPPAPTFTANAWLEKEGYGPTQLVTLLDLSAQLQAAGKASNKLNAVRVWANTILAEFVQSDAPKEDWGVAPFSFNETVAEAFGLLA